MPASVPLHILQARRLALTALSRSRARENWKLRSATDLDESCVSLPETIILQNAFGQNLTTWVERSSTG
jgi:hypothetical protein